MESIHYRLADKSDEENIAKLHAVNWQHHYRGIMSDDFLDHHVMEDRAKVWNKRFKTRNPAMQTVVAEMDAILIGFVCTFLDHDEKYGAYLDNLHVSTTYHGYGIGKSLMKMSAAWVHQNNPNGSLYLWVLEQNTQAINMYLHLGAKQCEKRKDPHQLDSGDLYVYRMVWNDVSALLK